MLSILSIICCFSWKCFLGKINSGMKPGTSNGTTSYLISLLANHIEVVVNNDAKENGSASYQKHEEEAWERAVTWYFVYVAFTVHPKIIVALEISTQAAQFIVANFGSHTKLLSLPSNDWRASNCLTAQNFAFCALFNWSSPANLVDVLNFIDALAAEASGYFERRCFMAVW